MSNLDDFRKGYAQAILWACAYAYTTDGELVSAEDAAWPWPGPGRWWECIGIDFTDADAFYANESATLWATGCADFAQHGHDFALTRNRHGAGFWDRGYPESIGNALTEAAHLYGEHSVLVDEYGTMTTF